MDENDIEFEQTDTEGGEQATKDKVKKLREELAKCQAERTEYLTGWQRAKADYINLKKEQEKMGSEIARFAKEGLLLELLTLADSFSMAFANKEAWEKVDKNWRLGVEYIYSQLESIFRDNGLVEINPVDQLFDPNIMQAVATVAVDEENKDHKVIEVSAKGYKMGERVLRPAKVKVGEYKH